VGQPLHQKNAKTIGKQRLAFLFGTTHLHLKLHLGGQYLFINVGNPFKYLTFVANLPLLSFSTVTLT